MVDPGMYWEWTVSWASEVSELSTRSTACCKTTVETSTAMVAPEPGTADCGPSAFAAGEFDDPAVLFCDGTWAFAGQNQTDWRMVFQATHGNWVAYQPHGETQTGMAQPCYDEETLRTDGAPDELIGQVPLCG